MMRFTIEQRHLTDRSGRPVPAKAVTFHTCEANNVDEAVHVFVGKRNAEIIGNVMTFPGFQAIATVRDPSGGVYTLQVTPTSGKYVVC
jgi:hypothetical protein